MDGKSVVDKVLMDLSDVKCPECSVELSWRHGGSIDQIENGRRMVSNSFNAFCCGFQHNYSLRTSRHPVDTGHDPEERREPTLRVVHGASEE